jgi:CRISPR-associated protein Cas2
MRVMLFFDLPTTSNKDVKAYQVFSREIKKNGYIMIQYSCYVKLVITPKMAALEENFIRKIIPHNGGNVQMLTITEMQYASIVYVMGENKSNIINTMEKIIWL